MIGKLILGFVIGSGLYYGLKWVFNGHVLETLTISFISILLISTIFLSVYVLGGING